MTEYNIPIEFNPRDYPFELRGRVAKFLNTHFGKFTIPQIAKELGAEEDKIAWVLSNLCELTSPEVVMGTSEGEEYWKKSIKLKSECPKSITNTTIFYGRIMV
jgi:hypothetical protein